MTGVLCTVCGARVYLYIAMYEQGDHIVTVLKLYLF